jgi:hypothetical protein
MTTTQYPVRRIAGTDCSARLSRRSNDGSIRDYAILDATGAVIGLVSWHTARVGRSAGYHEGRGCYSHDVRCFRNLAEAAHYFAGQVTA